MKKINLYILLFLTILQLTSCTTSETISVPKSYKIIIADNKNNTIKLFVHQGAGKYDEILPLENIYSIEIPAMRGGYSNFLGLKFNKHIPEDYKVIKLMKEEELIKEFSINEMEKFKKDDKGNYLMTIYN